MRGTAEELLQIRVLIADSAELVRRGIRDVLSQDHRFSVVGETVGAADIAGMCLELMPNIILLGLGPEDDASRETSPSLVALRETLALAPDIRALVLVDDDGVGNLLQPVRAGAHGVLLRDAPAHLLLQAMEDVVAGGGALDPRLARSLFDCWNSGAANAALSAGASRPRLAAAVLRVLSPREQEVLRSLVQGYRNKEIAAQLGVSVGTVKTHLRHIFRKLMVSDRTSAVLTALEARLQEAA